MNRLQFVLFPLLVALGMLAYFAYVDALDVEKIVAVVVFVAISVPVGIFGHRFRQTRHERR